jgi:cell wall-associated NlpC family hydrolase
LARPSGADQLSSAKAQAAQIEAEIQSTGQHIDALDQQYEAAQEHQAAIEQQITATQAKIAQTHHAVDGDQMVLRKAAINAYMSGGTAASQNPLFSGSQTASADAGVYNDVAEGNLGTAVANLHTAQDQLDAQEAVLHSQDQAAAAAVTAAQNAQQQAQAEEAQQQAALSQVNSQITALIKQQQASQEAAAQAAAQAKLAAAKAAAQAAAAASASTGAASDPPPPPAGGGAGTRAVAAAESQIGVPSVWGDESPGSGFDCSGLTAWAWGQAGVGLPHYSGAQMADSTPVPLSDLQPGDLLFYGPGGSEHVAMYVGGGQMIEAPYTGASVWITALRTGTGSFAGAGRP